MSFRLYIVPEETLTSTQLHNIRLEKEREQLIRDLEQIISGRDGPKSRLVTERLAQEKGKIGEKQKKDQGESTIRDDDWTGKMGVSSEQTEKPNEGANQSATAPQGEERSWQHIYRCIM